MFFKNKKLNQYSLFTFLVASILILPSIFQRGMFLDGITYAAISKNLANNIGTPFRLIYTQTIFNPFYEHPPFVFWLQSLFFKVFGSSFLIEKFYSLLSGLFIGWGIILIWNVFFENKKHNWVVIFIWITIPTLFWAYTNNILENSVSVFSIFAVYFLIQFIKTEKYKFLISGGIFIIISFLCKGFIGLFPLVTPLLYVVLFPKELKNKLVINIKLLMIFTFISFVLLSFFPDLKQNLINYFDSQLIPSLLGKREVTVYNRFKIIIDLIIELTFPILVLVVSFFTSKKRNFPYKKESLFFFLIGISASLPLIISMKQRKFYLVPSFPFYIIGFCLLILPLLEPKLNDLYNKRKKLIVYINIFLLISTLVIVLSFDGYLRDKNQIQDIQKIVSILEEGEIISTSKIFDKDWQTVAYFSREKYVSLTNKKGQKFYLKRKNEVLDKDIEGSFIEINLNLVEYNLYKQK